MTGYICRVVTCDRWKRYCGRICRTLKCGPTAAEWMAEAMRRATWTWWFAVPGLRPIPSVDMQALREAFRESNIPIIVDSTRLVEVARDVPSGNRAQLCVSMDVGSDLCRVRAKA